MPEETRYLDWQQRPPGAAMGVMQHVLLLPRTWWGTCVHAVAVQASIGVPLAVCEWSGHSQLSWGIFVSLPVLLAALVVFLGGLVATLRAKATGMRVMLWGLTGVLAGMGLLRLTGVARTVVFAACAERAQPLVDAITRFAQERRKPPAKLEDLVPAFLSEVPGTGVSAYPRFEFDQVGGEGQPHGSDWELRVSCPKGVLNWDVFFYWPSQDYPQQIYGGSVQRIGTWAYVHE